MLHPKEATLSFPEPSAILLILLFSLSNCGILFLNPFNTKKSSDKSILAIAFLRQNPSGAIDTTPPKVYSTSPAADTVGVKVNQPIWITFTEPVQSKENVLTVADSSGNTITGTIRWDKELIQFTPNSKFNYNTKYIVTLSDGISDSTGNKSESYQFSFTTEATPDLVAPVVTSTMPANAFVGYSIDSSITVTFSEDISPYSITATNILVQENGIAILPKLSIVNSVLTITSPSGWINATNYTVTIKKEILDKGNNQMLSDYTFSFQTIGDTSGPRVAYRIPESYLVSPPPALNNFTPGHSINDAVQITFDKSLFAASVDTNSVYIRQNGTINIPGTITVNNNKILFVPISPFPIGNFTATITTGISDSQGVPLAANYTFTFETRYTRIYSSSFHNCVLLPSGKLRCWGGNLGGQLGTGNFNSITTMDSAEDIRLGEPVLTVSVGLLQTCAILLSGNFKCWGSGITGTLGYGSLSTQVDPFYLPGLTTGERVIDLKTAGAHTCIVTQSGKYRCWGGNQQGQLGYGIDDIDSRPSLISGVDQSFASPVKEISVGNNHTCVILNNGSVKCWGGCTVGQCGFTPLQNTYPDSQGLPFLNLNLSGAIPTQISSLNNHTCATLNNGKAKCWGLGTRGQIGTIGTGSTVYDATTLIPIIDPSPNTITKMASGIQHSCALVSNGTLACWGDNSFAQLGLGGALSGIPDPGTPQGSASTALTSPISFLPANKIVDASAGYTHGCFILDTDEVRCFGTGGYYVLGDNTEYITRPVTGTSTLLNSAVPFYIFKRKITDYD